MSAPMVSTSIDGTSAVSLGYLRQCKRERRAIVMVTAYDYASARAADKAGIDIVLVGDSLATTMLGLSVTRDVSLEEMLVLTRAVRRGIRRPFLIGDMPYGTYEESNELAVSTARQFREAGCDAVKMEGAGEIVHRARAVIENDIPVMGHVGLTPQSLSIRDAPKVQGRTANSAYQLLKDANALEAVGCFALVLEAIPAAVTESLVTHIDVPTIGIGAGLGTDGQVLVTYDLLGLTEGHVPHFVRRYADLKRAMALAMLEFADDVRERRFPGPEHSYGIDQRELEGFRRRLAAETPSATAFAAAVTDVRA